MQTQEQTTASLVHVPFYGDALDAVRKGEDVFISIKRACENLGIDHDSQRKKLADKPWACTVMITVVDQYQNQNGECGRVRELAMLHLDSLPMWLATISINKVAPEARDKLSRYQCECAKVLARHFFGPAGKRRGRGPDALTVALKASREIRALGKAKLVPVVRQVLVNEIAERAGISFGDDAVALLDASSPQTSKILDSEDAQRVREFQERMKNDGRTFLATSEILEGGWGIPPHQQTRVQQTALGRVMAGTEWTRRRIRTTKNGKTVGKARGYALKCVPYAIDLAFQSPQDGGLQ